MYAPHMRESGSYQKSILFFSFSHFTFPTKDMECLGRLNRCIYQVGTETLSVISKKSIATSLFKSFSKYKKWKALLESWKQTLKIACACLTKKIMLVLFEYFNLKFKTFLSINLLSIISLELIFLLNLKR